uniref:Uncharacterized protein n=1 Tax=Poecilia latipinna TaxID=48699 RepID=A0A3B3TQS0_9TELE
VVCRQSDKTPVSVSKTSVTSGPHSRKSSGQSRRDVGRKHKNDEFTVVVFSRESKRRMGVWKVRNSSGLHVFFVLSLTLKII